MKLTKGKTKLNSNQTLGLEKRWERNRKATQGPLMKNHQISCEKTGNTKCSQREERKDSYEQKSVTQSETK